MRCCMCVKEHAPLPTILLVVKIWERKIGQSSHGWLPCWTRHRHQTLMLLFLNSKPHVGGERRNNWFLLLFQMSIGKKVKKGSRREEKKIKAMEEREDSGKSVAFCFPNLPTLSRLHWLSFLFYIDIFCLLLVLTI